MDEQRLRKRNMIMYVYNEGEEISFFSSWIMEGNHGCKMSCLRD